jgi:4-hydroxy-4-methyl-2-oxoglutarate aldolase
MHARAAGVEAPVPESLDAALVEDLRRLDAGAIANAIETRQIRLRNEGFSDGSIRAVFPSPRAVVGHAVTARIRCSEPPPVGAAYHDRTELWTHVLAVPPPRILVVEDIDERPGLGAFVGGVHAHILRALACVAYVTNGSVRDLDGVEAMGFQLFAPHVSVSHAFVHLVDFAQPVKVGGLSIASGDIVFGDRHGVLTIPPAIVADIPAIAARMREREQRVIDLCLSPSFSLDALRDLVRPLE